MIRISMAALAAGIAVSALCVTTVDAQTAPAPAMTERAERLGRAGDGEIVLSADGFLRWVGEPLARLIAGEDLLKQIADASNSQ